MPVAAIPAAIGAIGSIGGALIGSSASKNAAGQLVDAQGRVIQQANAAVQGGQNGINTATGQGQAGLSQAAGAGQAGASQGVANANQTLQGSAAAQLAQYAPYAQAGQDSLGQIQDLAGANGQLAQQFSFNPSDLQNDPGYQFTLQQGQQALQRAAAAKGGLFSAATSKALGAYTTGSANQYFNDAFSRAQNTFNTNRQGALARVNTLQGLAGMGLSSAQGGANAIGSTIGAAASNLANLGEFNANLGYNAASGGAQLGQQGAQSSANLGLQGADLIGRALTGQGQAQASGTIGSANAIQSGIGGVTNAASNIAKLIAGRSASNSVGGNGIPGYSDGG